MFTERPPLRVQLILIKRAAPVMSAGKKPNNIIKLIKRGGVEPRSYQDAMMPENQLDPCVYAQTHEAACFTNAPQRHLN